MTSQTSPAEFARLADRIRHCRICVESPDRAPLPHEPRPVFRGLPGARILIAGQAPGTRVHVSGLPYTDRSGDRLREWMGIGGDDFYDERRIAIVPMGFCFPGQDAKGGDLPPRRECAPAWREALLAHLGPVRLVLAVGLYAQRWHLPERRKASLLDNVSDWRSILAAPGRAPVVPLPHPSWRNNAWITRNPWFEAELLPALRLRIAAALAAN